MHKKKCKCEELKRKNSVNRNCCCENCNYDLKNTKEGYCPRCGQYTYDVFLAKKAFSNRIKEDVFDIKPERFQTFYNLKDLLIRPDYLIQMYLVSQ